MCKVSVITSVYNAEHYIGDTIRSILAQTFQDWEFIIIDDCSKDGSLDVIRSFHDPRIRLIVKEHNHGQCANLNYGNSIAGGKYIAHTDHDDYSYPERLQMQYDYMEAHPDVAICGSFCSQYRNGKLEEGDIRTISPNTPEQVKMLLYLRFSPLAHSSFFMRKDLLDKNGVEYGNFRYAEDYDIILHSLTCGEVGLVPEYLCAYCPHDDSVTHTVGDEVIDQESSEIPNHYLEQLPLRYKKILEKGNNRELSSLEDYREYDQGFAEMAEYCGIHDTKFLKHWYAITIGQQKNHSMMYRGYRTSRFRNSLFSVDNVKVLYHRYSLDRLRRSDISK